MQISKETISKLNICGDWVLMLKQEAFDGVQKIGNIYVPDTVNTNIMESKVGKVVAFGPGHTDDRGRFHRNIDILDKFVYYTRYGKETIDGIDGEKYIITRNRGVLAYVYVDKSNNIMSIEPRFDRLLLEEIKVGERELDSGLVLLDKKSKVDDYRRWKVIAVGSGEPKKYKTHIDYDNYIEPVSKVGDIVYAALQSGAQVSWYDQEGNKCVYRLIPESECVARECELV